MRNCYNKSCQRLWKEKGKEADKREDLQGLNLDLQNRDFLLYVDLLRNES